VAPESARLLRSTPSGGRAWVVPVPDLARSVPFFCQPGEKRGPREGLVVVAVGDAASGGGGALDHLVRGRAPVTVAPCAGADHSMLSISGIVPDGVQAVFLTAPDGTAVRADVKDNGYEFLLANQRATEQRYVVWTGGDGTPHVQPVLSFGAWAPSSCKALPKLSVARVSPDGAFPCMTPQMLAVPLPADPSRRSRALRRRRLARQPLAVASCWAESPVPPTFAMPARSVPAPAVPPPVRKPR
jgi:hypothetical protein